MAIKYDPCFISSNWREPIMPRSEEHTSEIQSHRDLHSFPTRRSSDLQRLHQGLVVIDLASRHGNKVRPLLHQFKLAGAHHALALRRVRYRDEDDVRQFELMKQG